MAAKSFVTTLIKEHTVVVFGKSWCGYCKKAIKALNGLKIEHHYEELEGRDDADDIQNYLKDLTGARSMPRVFVGGACIGGGDETTAAARNGTLEKKVKAASK